MKNKKENKWWGATYVGLMRMITLNFRLWGKPTKLGWRRNTQPFQNEGEGVEINSVNVSSSSQIIGKEKKNEK